jgi:predicted lipid-binding transport protein (Tim44 family)
MSPHIIELLLFAAVAFFLINKLISVLGTTTKEEQARFKDSIFGEPGVLKDVTATTAEISRISSDMFGDIVEEENKATVLANLHTVISRMPSFDLARFVKNSKAAFEILVNALKTSDNDTIEQLVDKRFIKSFVQMADKYSPLIDLASMKATVSELYMFGNNVFVKILFADGPAFREEWTFTKSAQSRDNNWFLSSVGVL